MSALLAAYRATGRRPTLIDKITHETCLSTLDAMQAAIGARGQELTDQEVAAFSLRRAELQKRKA